MIAGLSGRASIVSISVALLLFCSFLLSRYEAVRSPEAFHTTANSPPELLELNHDLATGLLPESLADDGTPADSDHWQSADSSARYIFAL